MKIARYTFIFSFLAVTASFTARAQDDSDSTGLPGDNFSLQGALEMFKKASSPEEFEKLLNSEDNRVNNLDLNGDGEIDYIRVIEKADGDAHIFVLQVPVSASENQDIAVIELEKTGNNEATVQIVGDEEIFGDQTIVEPGDGDDADDNSNGRGPNAEMFSTNGIIVNVWAWPCVRFVFRPAYAIWVSPWAWHRYPNWWHPWRPLRWHAYRPYRVRYYTGFAVVHTHRVVHAHRIYVPGRVTSVTVRSRHSAAVGRYRVTKRTTTVHGPRGSRKVKTTTVRRRRH